MARKKSSRIFVKFERRLKEIYPKIKVVKYKKHDPLFRTWCFKKYNILYCISLQRSYLEPEITLEISTGKYLPVEGGPTTIHERLSHFAYNKDLWWPYQPDDQDSVDNAIEKAISTFKKFGPKWWEINKKEVNEAEKLAEKYKKAKQQEEPEKLKIIAALEKNINLLFPKKRWFNKREKNWREFIYKSPEKKEVWVGISFGKWIFLWYIGVNLRPAEKPINKLRSGGYQITPNGLIPPEKQGSIPNKDFYWLWNPEKKPIEPFILKILKTTKKLLPAYLEKTNIKVPEKEKKDSKIIINGKEYKKRYEARSAYDKYYRQSKKAGKKYFFAGKETDSLPPIYGYEKAILEKNYQDEWVIRQGLGSKYPFSNYPEMLDKKEFIKRMKKLGVPPVVLTDFFLFTPKNKVKSSRLYQDFQKQLKKTWSDFYIVEPYPYKTSYCSWARKKKHYFEFITILKDDKNSKFRVEISIGDRKVERPWPNQDLAKLATGKKGWWEYDPENDQNLSKTTTEVLQLLKKHAPDYWDKERKKQLGFAEWTLAQGHLKKIHKTVKKIAKSTFPSLESKPRETNWYRFTIKTDKDQEIRIFSFHPDKDKQAWRIGAHLLWDEKYIPPYSEIESYLNFWVGPNGLIPPISSKQTAKKRFFWFWQPKQAKLKPLVLSIFKKIKSVLPEFIQYKKGPDFSKLSADELNKLSHDQVKFLASKYFLSYYYRSKEIGNKYMYKAISLRTTEFGTDKKSLIKVGKNEWKLYQVIHLDPRFFDFNPLMCNKKRFTQKMLKLGISKKKLNEFFKFKPFHEYEKSNKNND